MLWIDAICIDQENVAEKNTQVPLMSTIYSQATVLVWLGAGTRSTDDAMELMQDVAAQDATIAVSLSLDDMLDSQEQMESRLVSHTILDVMDGMADMIARPWFRRTWTLQEFSLPSSPPLIIIGNSSMCWDCFFLGFRHLWGFLSNRYLTTEYPEFEQRLDGLYKAMDNHWLERPMQLRASIQTTRHLNLEELLLISTYQFVSNPRDRIYGLLGLGPPEATIMIPVDYNAHVHSVFSSFVQYSFRQSNSLNILSWCAGLRKWDDKQPWPSWLPRLDRPLIHAPSAPRPLIGSTYQRCSIYHASQGLPNDFQIVEDERLSVWAFPVDKVDLTDNDFRAQPAGQNRESDFEAFAGVFARAAQSCGSCFGCQQKLAGKRKARKQRINRDLNGNTKVAAFATCSEPIYKPKMPRRPLEGLPSVDMIGLCYLPRDGSGPGADPSAETVKLIFEQSVMTGDWDYEAILPFHEALWRTMIGDYAPHQSQSHRSPAHISGKYQLLYYLQTLFPDKASLLLQYLGVEEDRKKVYDLWNINERDNGRVSRLAIAGATFFVYLSHVFEQRCAFVTPGGWMGFGPADTKPGDILVIISGADMPFLVRPRDDGSGEYLLVGEAYVQGLMHGEYFGMCPSFQDGRLKEGRGILHYEFILS
ncbi:heterokaryon incompatibility protein-domain-containing protein [Cercophora samala]|uniref:Heterokaryon incompatibility protein-domain-containing protein n=1 Tax=Cercophora samala TaxID=330535 RepID=A0AA39ZDW7_9PEZI|nr:heterokaryon incompatibility protein-domain-containing protein [Cercophora samala]